MAFKLNKSDWNLLSSIAEYRVLTTSQVAVLAERSARSARRRLRTLSDEGLVALTSRSFGSTPGRPEGLVSLASSGTALLRKEGILASDISHDQVGGEAFRPLDHQLLVNWFRLHLVHLERVNPRLSARFLAPTSPFLVRDGDGQPLITVRLSANGGRTRSAGFTPDGAFSITDRDRDMTLLFFLEADRGTESAGSPNCRPGTIRQKLVNYQAYFRGGGYRSYERLWACRLNGFRLLFLANSPGRLGQLCRAIQEVPPSDFVWLTDDARLFEHGVSGNIWARGGRIDQPPQSILGTLSCPAPIPSCES